MFSKENHLSFHKFWKCSTQDYYYAHNKINQQYSMLTTARTVNTSYLITLAQARLYGVEYIFLSFFFSSYFTYYF